MHTIQCTFVRLQTHGTTHRGAVIVLFCWSRVGWGGLGGWLRWTQLTPSSAALCHVTVSDPVLSDVVAMFRARRRHVVSPVQYVRVWLSQLANWLVSDYVNDRFCHFSLCRGLWTTNVIVVLQIKSRWNVYISVSVSYCWALTYLIQTSCCQIVQGVNFH